MIRDTLRRLRRTSRGIVGTNDRRLMVALRYNGLFDADWYLARNPDVAASGMDPFDHFLSSGKDQLRDPSPLFSCRFYLDTNLDVAQAGVHPLDHYISSGGAENRQPHPLVAPHWIRRMLPGAFPFDNPLLGLLLNDADLGPRPMVHLGFIRAQLGLAEDLPVDRVLSAYFTPPPRMRMAPHPLFDGEWMRARLGADPDEDMLVRYARAHGLEVSPHPLFDKDHVWARNPQLHALPSGYTLLDHALTADAPELVATSVLFDNAHYRAQAGDRATEGQIPLMHYMAVGTWAGLDPSPWFDDRAYRARYLADDPWAVPLDHYARHGRAAHITLAPRFPDRFYAARYPEVRAHFHGPPLQHWLECGMAENRKLREPAWTDDFDSWAQVRAEVVQGLGRPAPEAPDVSVIVPVYNQFLHTLRCVWSILRAGDAARLQLIIADDGSTDGTEAFFRALPGVTYIRNPENMGFLRSCNNAAQYARAPWLFLLNNDTAVLPGWIDRLLDVARAEPDAGLVGAKLVYPDGTLQEAGGFVWSDGGGANMGRNSDPREPGYNLRRDADYISGAAILVPRAVWVELGGFDTRYVPAYCEDTDLAMRLRNLGYRVIYQPAATVVHFEGVSSGTSTDSGVKAWQVVNFRKLAEKWRFALERHHPAQDIDPRRVPRPPRPRILMIDANVPEPDKDAGSVIAVWHIRLLLDLGYDVTFLPVSLQPFGPYGAALQAMGVELVHAPYVQDIHGWITGHAADFHLFWLVRFAEGGAFVERLRQLCPQTPVVLNTCDLHFLRAEREARRQGGAPEAMERAWRIRDRELAVIGAADDTILVSTYERDHLRAMGRADSLSIIPLVLEPVAQVPPHAGRSGIAFVGGYQHTPNVDAVLWFVEHVWPLLRGALPDLEFHVVGSNPPPAILSLTAPGVRVQGFVPDLDGFLARRIATVAPLQYGAGIKGKIGSSLAAGVPCVSTSIGAEGMGLTDGQTILIADDPDRFVAQVVRLVADPGLWARLSVAGQDFVRAEYAPEATRARLLRVIAKVGAEPFSGLCPLTGQREARRFLHDGQPDSLVSAPDAPQSSERIAARALLALAPGLGAQALAGLAPGSLPPVAVWGAMPALAAALDRSGTLVAQDGAQVVAARLPLDDRAPADLAALLAALPAGVGRLVLACPPVGMAPGRARAPAPRLAALVRGLEAAGWEVRTDRIPAPEAALTGVALIEARRNLAPRLISP